MKDIKVEDLTKIPLQTQITYTLMNGMKCIRILTKVQDASSDRGEVEKEANTDILAINAAQQASKMAAKGKFREAQAYSMGAKKFIKRSVKTEEQREHFQNWKNNLNDMYDGFQMQNELEEGALSDVDEAEEEQSTIAKPRKQYKSKMNDHITMAMGHNKRFNKKALKKRK